MCQWTLTADAYNDIADARKLAETLEKNDSSLVGIQQNLVDLVWGKDRPAAPRELVKVHPVKYAGKSFQDKITDLRKELQNKKKAGFVVCMIIEVFSFHYVVCWLIEYSHA